MSRIEERTTRPGRPRDPGIEARVLDATRELLAEGGFAATTVQEIARRSGVHPPAIYRRWSSRLALIEDAAFSGLTEIELVPTGDLRSDLQRFLEAYDRNLSFPAARSAMPGLLAAYQGEAQASPARWAHLSVRPQLYAILAAATPGSVDPALDPDDIFDVILATVLARVVVPTGVGRSRAIVTTVDLLLRMLRP